MPWFTIGGLTTARLVELGGRAHMTILGRYITVLRHPRTHALYCIDSSCFHAGGPLGEGPIEDIEDIPCVRCPWHNFCVALDTGERIFQNFKPPALTGDGAYTAAAPPSFPLKPWPQEYLAKAERSGSTMQRVHPTTINDATGEICVMVEEKYPATVGSDRPSTNERQGRLCQQMVIDRDKAVVPLSEVKALGPSLSELGQSSGGAAAPSPGSTTADDDVSSELATAAKSQSAVLNELTRLVTSGVRYRTASPNDDDDGDNTIVNVLRQVQRIHEQQRQEADSEADDDGAPPPGNPRAATPPPPPPPAQ